MKILDVKSFISEKMKIVPISNNDLNKINGDIDLDYFKFCKDLEIKDSNDSKKLYSYYKIDCEKDCYAVFDDFINEFSLESTKFELLLMIAAMLVNDYKKVDDIIYLGTKQYTGYLNPYSCPWFTKENEYGINPLSRIQVMFSHDEEFKRFFIKFFKIVKNCGHIKIKNVLKLHKDI